MTEQPITYQWIKKGKAWHVHAMVEEMLVPIVTNRLLGGLGIDCNPRFLSLGRISHDGNPIWVKDLVHQLEGKSANERKTILAGLVKEAVLLAQKWKIPIIIEMLDFKAKKREWKSAGYNRMLSSFAYSQFHQLIRATAAQLGVEVISINPRDTTTIGIIKFQGYGFSKDQGAAIAIARRGLQFTERVRGRMLTALPLPVTKQLVRDQGRHVMSPWPRLRRSLILTGNGWQFKVDTKAKARVATARLSDKQTGVGENPLSRKTPVALRPLEPTSSDVTGRKSKSNLVSVGARVPTPGGTAVRSPRSTRRKSDIGFYPQGIK